MNRLPGILIGLVCMAGPSLSQPPDNRWSYRVEVFGNLASGRLYHGSHVLGKGRDFGGGVGIRPFSGWLHRLGFEVQAGRLSRDESTPAYPSLTLDASMVTVNALYHFLDRSRVQPYLLGGIGHVNSDYYRKCVSCVATLDPVTGALTPLVTEDRMDVSKFGVTFGGGLKVALQKHVWVRPEVLVVNTTGGSGANLVWLRVQIGLGAHF